MNSDNKLKKLVALLGAAILTPGNPLQAAPPPGAVAPSAPPMSPNLTPPRSPVPSGPNLTPPGNPSLTSPDNPNIIPPGNPKLTSSNNPNILPPGNPNVFPPGTAKLTPPTNLRLTSAANLNPIIPGNPTDPDGRSRGTNGFFRPPSHKDFNGTNGFNRDPETNRVPPGLAVGDGANGNVGSPQ